MEGLQIYGGYGYTMEYDIQRYVRDSRRPVRAGTNNRLWRQHSLGCLCSQGIATMRTFSELFTLTKGKGSSDEDRF
jgi:hypothetical protein